MLEQRRMGTLTSNGAPPGSRQSGNVTVAVLFVGVGGPLSSVMITDERKKESRSFDEEN